MLISGAKKFKSMQGFFIICIFHELFEVPVYTFVYICDVHLFNIIVTDS